MSMIAGDDQHPAVLESNQSAETAESRPVLLAAEEYDPIGSDDSVLLDLRRRFML
jgi:hypothetical protein